MRFIIICLLSCWFLAACQSEFKVSNFSKVPDYEWVFPENEVRSITINLGQENWNKVQADMEWRTARKFGSATTIPGAVTPPVEGVLDAVPGDPVFVQSEVTQGDATWKNVGFRLKGNASLAGSWRNGIYKLPFKLKFDEFESQNPKISNQRFYGFKELSFAPSYGDNSFMKEKILTTMFRKSGVLACRVAYYKVYIDFGQGPRYCGIYQAIENVEEHLVPNQVGQQVGNVYKPESTFQQFVRSQFEKQNNQAAGDYLDVSMLVYTINSPLRTSNNALWKKELEALFDVKEFLRYLALNNISGNWDSYGVLAHNSFLVNINGVLHWVPYDLNLSFSMRGGANNARFSLTMDMKEVTNNWPLIRRIIDEPEYFDYYKNAVKTLVDTQFNPTNLSVIIKKEYNILRPYFYGSLVEAVPYSTLPNVFTFENAVSDLEKYAIERHAVAADFVK